MMTVSTTSPSSSPPTFDLHSVPASTAPSSVPPTPPDVSEYGDSELNPDITEHFEPDEEEKSETERKYARLQFVLKKSAIYSNILKARMDEDKAKLEAAAAAKKEAASRPSTRKGKGRKRIRVVESESSDEEKSSTKRRKEADGQARPPAVDLAEPSAFQQPALITGAKLKDYQLEGLQWMVSLDQNGISGILADEMGLGKTIQTIAFSAYLRECKNTRPFMVVCPLSVLHNWVIEYKKFAPSIPVCMYHGTPEHRAELRKTVLSLSTYSKFKSQPQAKAKRTRGHPPKGRKKDQEEEEDPMASFPVVITTYEMIIKDRVHLARYDWGYIVVDEGHRLKNLNCKLIKEIKKYPSAGRMLLTGTPLHNNLAELWSLLNFILPDIFDDLDAFGEWFNIPSVSSDVGSERTSNIISSLHAILKPFLLRRVKADVELGLPPKKEYILYTPLTMRQREAYEQIVEGTIRSYLIGHHPAKEEPEEESNIDPDAPRQLRKLDKKNYDLDGDDEQYFEMLENGEIDERGVKPKVVKDEDESAKLGQEYHYKEAVKHVNNMKLQNIVMQLRKVCSHPYLFEWPADPERRRRILTEDIVDASGKMMVLDRLLRELHKRGHKVLLFSQFTTMLDIIEDWAIEFMGWKICRIDGSSSLMTRQSQMEQFQTGKGPSAPFLFLLSTRAGGLGVNLTAADTVIFYDQDWNPQMDIQAQDRAHRIGQTKPVLIFRLVSAHTIETKIMQRATEKRRLEALVIAKGKFKMPAVAAGRNKPETMAEMAASLLRLEGEKISVVPNTAEGKRAVISDADLDMLLDRSPEVFTDRGKGWTSSGKVAAQQDVPGLEDLGKGKKSAAFAVYEAPVDQGNGALAHMMGEDPDAIES